jgi:hypothetical protein
MEQLDPVDGEGLARFREVVGGAFDVILGRRLDDVGEVAFEPTSSRGVAGGTLRLGLLRPEGRGEELPTAVLEPRGEWNGETVVWIHEDGFRGLFDETAAPVAEVQRLLGAGFAVAGVDLLLQGELRSANLDPAIGRTRARQNLRQDGSEGWHRAGVFTFGYNPALFARRVHDVLSAIRHFQDRGARVSLVGLGPVAGPIVVAARAQANGAALSRVAVDTGNFRFASLDRLDDPMMLPGAVKYLDLPALLALGAGELWLSGEGDTAPTLVAHAFQTRGETGVLHVHDGPADAATVVDWMIGD